jgi:CRISPR-associated protein Csx14
MKGGAGITQADAAFAINVDVSNPGQFFACCGLLELAGHLWPGAEGWFDGADGLFAICAERAETDLGRLISELRTAEISSLTDRERREREDLETKRRKLKKENHRLSQEEETRLKELGSQARAGPLQIGNPFFLRLNWWEAGDDEGAPKTWAGRQELHKIARATQDALFGVGHVKTLLDHACVLRMPKEYCKGKADPKKSVEPFYFDARRFAPALDAGYSLDVQDTETIAYPAVELLSLIGLERFRPSPGPHKWTFDYWVWSRPLSPLVAAPIVSGLIRRSDSSGYRFRLRFRDDQKRYKAFGFATPTGGQI